MEYLSRDTQTLEKITIYCKQNVYMYILIEIYCEQNVVSYSFFPSRAMDSQGEWTVCRGD